MSLHTEEKEISQEIECGQQYLDDPLPFASQILSSEGTSRRVALVALLAVASSIAIALGAGLGVGLHPDHISQVPLAVPGNSSDVSEHVTRQSILGDQSRWLLSNRPFEISSTPTTRVFNWSLSEAWAAPGGIEKPMILVNKLSPGPKVEANLGDRLILNIFNNMTNETSIHWHGQYSRNENYMDGTQSFTQISTL